MRAFLAVSVAPRAADRLPRPSAAVLSCLADDETAVDRVDESADGWVAFAGRDELDVLGELGDAFTVRLSLLLRTREEELSTADIPALIAAGEPLAELLPPFAAAHRATAGAPVRIANDWLGYRQLFWWQGDGIAAVSTSARALAVLTGRGLDRAGLGAQAMIGWQVGDRTIFEGVRSLPPATIVTLAGGEARFRAYAEPLSQDGAEPKVDDAVAEMADILLRWQTAYVEGHPDSVLQLTGGHDSRILLGAIPEKLRAGRRALTLGEPNHPDVVIAGRLCEKYDMRHEVHRLDDVKPTPAR